MIVKQRIAFLQKLLQDTGLSEYGFTDEELLQLTGLPTAKVIELLINLKRIKK